MKRKQLSYMIAVRLTPDEFRALRELAEREVRSVSNLVRKAALAAVQDAGLLPAPEIGKEITRLESRGRAEEESWTM